LEASRPVTDDAATPAESFGEGDAGPIARLVAALLVGFVAGLITRQLRKRLRLPFWIAPLVGILVAALMHRQLDERVAQILARQKS
jgi:fructose-specific phosphotransferase system IIC component